MTISQMHVMFRQYAQQMGMQNVRAILPEQIDLLLNTSIMDIVNQTIKENIGITNDRVITDNSKIGQINALRTLYKVALIDMSPLAVPKIETRAFAFDAADRNTGRMTTNFNKISPTNYIPDYMFLVDFSLSYKKVKGGLGYTGINKVGMNGGYGVLTPEAAIKGTYEQVVSSGRMDSSVTVEAYNPAQEQYVSTGFYPLYDWNETTEDKLTTGGDEPDYLGVEGLNTVKTNYGGRHYVTTKTFKDGDANYNGGVLHNPLVIYSSTYATPIFDDNAVETNYFPVRIIDDAYLADTLNDFILKNRLRSPIMVVYNNNTFDLYIDKFEQVMSNNGYDPRYTLRNGLLPYKLRMSYIAKPAKVKYDEDLNGTEGNVDCDLPEYQHIDVVKHAVDLYRVAVSGSLYAAQQQAQNEQQENVRNNYRNDDNTNSRRTR